MDKSLLGLENRVAIVTGGGGNIGAATVRMLAEAGAHVLAADIIGEDAEKAVATARALGAQAVALQVDTRRQQDVDRMVKLALDTWGRLDVGVNVVGGGGGGKSVLESTDADWEAAIDLNLYTALRCSRSYARAMIERNTDGSIINIASPAGLRAAPSLGPYGAAKAAVINLTWTLAVEWAKHGIRVNVVVPAFVPKPGYTFGGSPEQQLSLARQVVPMGRPTKAEDVAGAILCFASPNLTSYSTGQVMVCDGGRLLTNPIFGPVGT